MEADLRSRVEKAVREEIVPALQMDGLGIEVRDVTDGIVNVRIGGGCGSCPSSVMAVIMGLEQELRRLVPEVEFVELVE